MKPVEQVSEVKTSKLGAVLLAVMVFFIFAISQIFLNDIKGIIEKPELPSSCISTLTTKEGKSLTKDYCKYNYSYTYGYSEKSNTEYEFNPTDIEFGLDRKYKETITKLQPLFTINENIQNENRKLNGLRNDLYDKDPSFNPLELKNQKDKIQALEIKANEEFAKIKSNLELLSNDYKEAYDKTKFKRFFYYLADFFLQLIFILPFFGYGLKKYFKLKKTNSPYTIIFTAIVAATALVIVQTVIVFLFEVLPWGFLEKIWTWLQDFKFLRYIFYYAVIGLTIGLFGGVVYYIQKNAFASDKVQRRRIIKGQCPNCENKIKDSFEFCRGCGESLKITCKKCKKSTSKFFKFCSSCGCNLTSKK